MITNESAFLALRRHGGEFGFSPLPLSDLSDEARKSLPQDEMVLFAIPPLEQTSPGSIGISTLRISPRLVIEKPWLVVTNRNIALVSDNRLMYVIKIADFKCFVGDWGVCMQELQNNHRWVSLFNVELAVRENWFKRLAHQALDGESRLSFQLEGILNLVTQIACFSS